MEHQKKLNELIDCADSILEGIEEYNRMKDVCTVRTNTRIEEYFVFTNLAIYRRAVDWLKVVNLPNIIRCKMYEDRLIMTIDPSPSGGDMLDTFPVTLVSCYHI